MRDAPFRKHGYRIFALEFLALFFILLVGASADVTMIPRIAAISHSSMNRPFPQEQPSRHEYVRSMFDGIAAHYDFLNHFLSSGFDILWRKKAIRLLVNARPKLILDIATGTGDFAIEAARTLGAHVVGIDFSQQMLTLGREKVRQKGLERLIHLKNGNAETLDEADNTIDAVTVAFGVRNFANVHRGLAEMFRVLKQGGTVLILEFSKPKAFPFRQLYGLYFHRILPMVGGMVSKSRESYEYLPRSVAEFPDDSDFLELMHNVGFVDTQQIRLTFGIATIYVGTKRV